MEQTTCDDNYHIINVDEANDTYMDDETINNKIKHVIMMQEQEHKTRKNKSYCYKYINFSYIAIFFLVLYYTFFNFLMYFW